MKSIQYFTGIFLLSLMLLLNCRKQEKPNNNNNISNGTALLPQVSYKNNPIALEAGYYKIVEDYFLTFDPNFLTIKIGEKQTILPFTELKPFVNANQDKNKKQWLFTVEITNWPFKNSYYVSYENKPQVEEYILISTPEELQNIKNHLNGKYKQIADIDLQNIAFSPIGDSRNPFTGTYEGNNYKITNLSINSTEIFVGLFGMTKKANLNHIQLENVEVKTTQHSVGALVGELWESKLSNSHASGTVAGDFYVGGLVGSMLASELSNSYATTAVTGGNEIGGLAGNLEKGSKILNSYATGKVEGFDNVGGLIGRSMSGSNIEKSYATGAVRGHSQLGGLVGYATESTISNNYATADVNSFQGARVGGLIGCVFDKSNISKNYATGKISGDRLAIGIGITNKNDFGGLIGATFNSNFSENFQTENKVIFDNRNEQIGFIPTGVTAIVPAGQTQVGFTNWDFSTIWALTGMGWPTLK